MVKKQKEKTKFAAFEWKNAERKKWLGRTFIAAAAADCCVYLCMCDSVLFFSSVLRQRLLSSDTERSMQYVNTGNIGEGIDATIDWQLADAEMYERADSNIQTVHVAVMNVFNEHFDSGPR